MSRKQSGTMTTSTTDRLLRLRRCSDASLPAATAAEAQREIGELRREIGLVISDMLGKKLSKAQASLKMAALNKRYASSAVSKVVVLSTLKHCQAEVRDVMLFAAEMADVECDKSADPSRKRKACKHSQALRAAADGKPPIGPKAYGKLTGAY